ncbi:MAG: Crp/Fnr family transcriptional regulator [Chitinophagales bacterium]|nr:Crp/Fnr family transcriptional regulator [Chitinophagales bacterium]HMW95493.1 Crp/Fnr family transcriptional regulator [Chitinophagales bacterium]HNK90835.1 Crp/Fnr family transcriptional regulator [Chitinophagales bacterium]HNM67948.1 Crp/Fnr family transcriptional regulator [Chitinophagales bacterium]HNO49153.1 Crp/Fnr family transcriptional regulator [Chitinophagales bacterium]
MTELNQVNEFKTSPDLKEKLYQYSIIKNYQEGTTVLRENSNIHSIPIVTKGSIKVMRTDDEDKEILLYYIKPGESCIMSFLGGLHQETSKVKAIVEEDAEILFLPIDKVTILMKEYPQWLEYIFKLYHKRFEELLEVVNAIAFKKVDERLLLLLNKKVELTKSKVIQITHEQLANELGTARVVVSRLLKQLEEEKKVVLGRNKITVL